MANGCKPIRTLRVIFVASLLLSGPVAYAVAILGYHVSRTFVPGFVVAGLLMLACLVPSLRLPFGLVRSAASALCGLMPSGLEAVRTAVRHARPRDRSAIRLTHRAAAADEFNRQYPFNVFFRTSLKRREAAIHQT
jgi:hypothetical protein